MPLQNLTEKHSVLFVLKSRDQNWGQPNLSHYNSSGLLNSARFIKDMLTKDGVRAELVQVHDGNGIDKEVHRVKPSIVILEAIWCPPYKVKELAKLYPKIKWIIRNHSELPFLALEGVSIQWLLEYVRISNTHISCNSPVSNGELGKLVQYKLGVPASNVLLLPNYYPELIKFMRGGTSKYSDTLNVGCFGAIRPLKNHVEQAIASIICANRMNKNLNFHINATRLECNADPVLKSLRAIFSGSDKFKLIEHGWLNSSEFLELCRSMDVGLQVSFSETFNIVAADLVSVGVPVVSSDEIPWIPDSFHAEPTSAEHIAHKMEYALKTGMGEELRSLRRYSNESEQVWLKTLFTL